MDDLNEVTGKIIGAAIEVHRVLGPGLLESAYEACMMWELRASGLKVEAQVPVPILYKGLELHAGYRVDMIVENRVVVELKAMEKILPIHVAQVLTYLKMTKMQMALILNFNVELMRTGIKRVINDI